MTISQIFNSQTKTIAFAAGLLAVSSLISRFLGLIRNAMLSWRFGASESTDMYFAAFQIPDFLYAILITGGVSVVFLPLFASYMEQNKEEAWKFASNLLNSAIGILVGLAVLAALFAPLLMKLVAPGFTEDQIQVASNLTRLMLLSPILFGISSIFSGMLQYFNKFFAYSLAPILYNLGIMFGIVFLVPLFDVWGLGLGVVLGALFHVLIQIPAAIQSGFSWRAICDMRHPSIQKAIRMTFPRTIASAGFQFNLVVITALASLISAGSITIFQYANDLQYVSIGLVGAPFSIAAFSALSRLFAQQNFEQMKRVLSRTTAQIIFFLIPFSVLLFLLRAQIVRLVYGSTPKFTWEDTQLTAAVLGIFAFGLVLYGLIPLFARSFFAMQDTKTPTIFGLMAIALNIGSAIGLMQLFATENAFQQFFVSFLKLQNISDVRILAFPLAFVISGMFQVATLAIFLMRAVPALFDKAFFLSVRRTFMLTTIIGIATYATLHLYGAIIPLRTYTEVLFQFLSAGLIGMLAGIATGFAVKSPELLSLVRRLKKTP